LLFIQAALAMFSASIAAAFPIALPGSEGAQIFVTGNNPVIATYQGNSASYSNDLFLMLNASGLPGDDGDLANDLFIFNNHASPVGSTVNLGSFVVGTELEFRLFVHNTGNNFYTGPAARNPDSHEHARVQQNWQPSETLVSFEDLFNGAFIYNDLSFSFTNTSTTPTPTGTPEPASIALSAGGLAALMFLRRLRGRQARQSGISPRFR
jgi:hypothetical protein